MKAFDFRESKGRRKAYDEDLLVHDIDPFLSDYLKIIQSKAVRRLADKTQVLCFPENPHVRTRRVHTDEVVAVSSTISEKLGLNTKLCQAIAAGHDIGHTPYGHLGETVLSKIDNKPFKHYVFSAIVAEHIERKGFGLNLTYETLEGILNHSRGKDKLSLDNNILDEYNVVMYSDKIAYTFSDINDAVRYGYLNEENMPSEVKYLGDNQRQRNDKCIRALITESLDKGKVCFSSGEVFEMFSNIREFMYNEVYFKLDFDMHEQIIKKAYEYFASEEFFDNFSEYSYENSGIEIENIDPIVATALLTDREANKFGDFILQTRKPSIHDISHFGVLEILPYISSKNIDIYSSTLNPKDFS